MLLVSNLKRIDPMIKPVKDSKSGKKIKTEGVFLVKYYTNDDERRSWIGKAHLSLRFMCAKNALT